MIYDKEKFIGKVMNIMTGTSCGLVLTKPLGVNTPQGFEKDDPVYYETVYYTSITPKLVRDGTR